MRRKIEIHSDEWHEAEGPETAPDGMAPDIADHINPTEPIDTPVNGKTDAASTTGVPASPSSCWRGLLYFFLSAP